MNLVLTFILEKYILGIWTALKLLRVIYVRCSIIWFVSRCVSQSFWHTDNNLIKYVDKFVRQNNPFRSGPFRSIGQSGYHCSGMRRRAVCQDSFLMGQRQMNLHWVLQILTLWSWMQSLQVDGIFPHDWLVWVKEIKKKNVGLFWPLSRWIFGHIRTSSQTQPSQSLI